MKGFYPFPSRLHWRLMHHYSKSHAGLYKPVGYHKRRNLERRAAYYLMRLRSLEASYREEAEKVFAARGVKFNP